MLKLFAVWDEKAEAYGSLICLPTRGLALRAFSDACIDSNSPMHKTPSDYKMVELGTYDPNTGQVSSLNQPAFVASATQIANQATFSPQPLKEVSALVGEVL